MPRSSTWAARSTSSKPRIPAGALRRRGGRPSQRCATGCRPSRRARRRPGLEIRPATPDDRAQILGLLQRSLGWGDDPRFAELYRWKHETNAFGPSPTWVAVDGDRIAGVRIFMRWEFVRGGRVLRAVRAVDTATDPDYQGRGLFTALTIQALDEMKSDGVDFVFNTPNDQSLPGYLKMGWREVGRLPAAVRMRGPGAALKMVRARVPSAHWSEPIAGRRAVRRVGRRQQRHRPALRPAHSHARHQLDPGLLPVALRHP